MNSLHSDFYEMHPLSYGQRALWFLQQMYPENVAYNVFVAARIISCADGPGLQDAFGVLASRHGALRTNFVVRSGEPMQQVCSQPDLDFQEFDARDCTEAETIEQMSVETHRSFNLERDRLLRVRVWVRAPSEVFLLLVLHHSVVDAASLFILLEELGRYYGIGELEDRLPPSASSQFSDYARWERRMTASAEGEAHWKYWMQQLKGDLPLLDVPTDFPREVRQTFNGATKALGVSQPLIGRLKDVAAFLNVTLDQLLLVAFQVLLHCWSGQDRVLLGSPYACRTRPEFKRTVGYLVNPVVLSADLSGSPCFSEVVRQATQTMGEVSAHHDYPFPLLVERLQIRRNVARSPVFQALFSSYDAEQYPMLALFSGTAGLRVRMGSLLLESLNLRHRGAMLDLSMIVMQGGDSTMIRLQYNTDLFKEETITRALDDYLTILEQVAANPTVCVTKLPVKMARDWSGSARVYQHDYPEKQLPDARHQKPSNEIEDLAFSLFYFASSGASNARDKYRLLLEGAKFADRNGLAAVWTPERHFHRFGGLYPNPAVTGASIASITDHIRIRAGSVVLPLHHPVRVVEEWSVVDNLSNGRVEVSFATGWNINDFVLGPQNYVERKSQIAEAIEIVRKLWRGETQTFPGVNGESVTIAVLPRPVQRELPVWLSAFGNVNTFRLAGRLGAGILTHLVGQSVDDLAAKIGIYRDTLRRYGYHPSAGRVAVMLHTFLGPDEESVRQAVQVPFLNYLKSCVDVSFGAGIGSGISVDPTLFSAPWIDSFLGTAFDRYCQSCALFGSPESCSGLLDRLEAAGVNEIACLIDFGVEEDMVLSSLPYLEHLQALRRASKADQAAVPSTPLEAGGLSLKRGVERAATRLESLKSTQRLIASRRRRGAHEDK
jgi:natural product biosynthesis luciferase-like monooxygenase protein